MPVSLVNAALATLGVTYLYTLRIALSPFRCMEVDGVSGWSCTAPASPCFLFVWGAWLLCVA